MAEISAKETKGESKDAGSAPAKIFVPFEGEDTSAIDGTQRNFSLPPVFASNERWGPPALSQTPIQSLIEAGVPYAPFNKSERLGRISDWQQTGYQQQREILLSNAMIELFASIGKNFGNGGQNVAFGYQTEEDEESFTAVDRPKK